MTVGASIGDRRRGLLAGTVVGDAFGNPLEGAPASTLKVLIARRSRQASPWRYTDDGAMTIALAESLCQAGTVEPANLLAKMRARYEPARGFGRGMKLAFAAYDQGLPPSRVPYAAWPEGSRGNGGAVRVGVVALRPWTDIASLRAAAAAATQVTHAHDDALAASLIQVAVAALVLDEPVLVDAPSEFLQRVAAIVGHSPSAHTLIDRIRSVVIRGPSPSEILRSFGNSTLALESAPAAIASFLCFHSSFAHTILEAASLGGDVDSICAIAGALAGALHGFDAIPPQWTEALVSEDPTLDELCHLADKLGALEPRTFCDEAV